MVFDQYSGVVIGYFISPDDFEAFSHMSVLAKRSRFASEMPMELADALRTPLTSRRPELDDLMDSSDTREGG